jgi:hypothetical protein
MIFEALPNFPAIPPNTPKSFSYQTRLRQIGFISVTKKNKFQSINLLKETFVYFW